MADSELATIYYYNWQLLVVVLNIIIPTLFINLGLYLGGVVRLINARVTAFNLSTSTISSLYLKACVSKNYPKN